MDDNLYEMTVFHKPQMAYFCEISQIKAEILHFIHILMNWFQIHCYGV